MHGGMAGVMKLEKVNGFPLQMLQGNWIMKLFNHGQKLNPMVEHGKIVV